MPWNTPCDLMKYSKEVQLSINSYQKDMKKFLEGNGAKSKLRLLDHHTKTSGETRNYTWNRSSLTYDQKGFLTVLTV